MMSVRMLIKGPMLANKLYWGEYRAVTLTYNPGSAARHVQVAVNRFCSSSTDGKSGASVGKNAMDSVFSVEFMGNTLYTDLKEEYDFVDKMNYIDHPNLCFLHEVFPGKIKVTSNYDLAREVNRPGHSSKVCYMYVPPRVKEVLNANWDNQRLLRTQEQLSKWSGLKGVPERFLVWGMKTAGRWTEGIPGLSDEQRFLACRQTINGFIVDDPAERLMVNNDWWEVGSHYIGQLLTIYSGHFDPTVPLFTDYRGMKGTYGIPDEIMEQLSATLEVNIEMEQEMRQIYSPAVYKVCTDGIRDNLEGILLEQPSFERKVTEAKEQVGVTLKAGEKARVMFEPAERFQHIRQKTIGVYWATAFLLKSQQAAKYVEPGCPWVGTLSWISALDNDMLGAPKDRVGNDYSPHSHSNYLRETTELDALTIARMVCSRANDLKKAFENLAGTMPNHVCRHHQQMELGMYKLMDFHLVSGINSPNDRYGWIPHLDQD